MFLPRDASASAVDRPALRAIEDDEVRRRALDEADRTRPPRPVAEDAGRDRSSAPRWRERAAAARHRPRRAGRPSAVSMPLIPLAAWPNSTALSTSVCGAWSVAIASAVPSRSAARQAAASSGDRSGGLTRSDDAYGAATSASSAHGSPLAVPRPATRARDPLVGQRQVMRRDVAGHRQAGGLRAPDEVQRRGRSTRGSGAAGRPARRAATSARTARSRATAAASAAAGQPRSPRTVATNPSFASAPSVRLDVLGVVDDRQPERARVGQRRPQDRRRPDRRPVVGEPDDAGIGQLAERRQPLPCPPDRHRAVRQQLDRRPGRDRRRPAPGPARPARRAPASCWASRRPS